MKLTARIFLLLAMMCVSVVAEAWSGQLEIDLSQVKKSDFCFPVYKAKAVESKETNVLQLTNRKTYAVKSMFAGTVRVACKHPKHGNIVIVSHPNGLETVYADNALNLVKKGDRVKAGQTIAIVGGIGRDAFCSFSVLANGRKINPEALLDLQKHSLLRATLHIEEKGDSVVATAYMHDADGQGLMAYSKKNPLSKISCITLNLPDIAPNRWAYPLPNGNLISAFGGARRHQGIDLKTFANDTIVAAFEGVVIRSGPFAAYGNCIEIKHANGIKTLYSHQSKNLVKEGDFVRAGQPIGLAGRTGRATTEHLHFEFYCQGKRHNPELLYDTDKRRLKNIKVKFTCNGDLIILDK